MEEHGMIHESLDLKILILYIINRLPGPIDGNALAELCQSDAGVNYFDFFDCLSKLIKSGHIKEVGNKYLTTEKGMKNGTTVESSLPYTVREKADKAIEPVAARMRRDAMIKASCEPAPDCEGFVVSLSLSDNISELMSLKLYAPSEDTAEKMLKSFRKSAERHYNRIAEILLEDN